MSIDAVSARDVVKVMLDLALHRAETAGRNIAGAAVPGYMAKRVDTAAFIDAVRSAAVDGELPSAADAGEIDTAVPVSLDGEVAELVAAGSDYQALVEVLNRNMSLMRLAISARS